MNQIFTTLIFIFGFSILSNAQSVTSQILNKESIKMNTVLSQDYDGDGDLDIVMVGTYPNQVIWLENEPTLQFPKHAIITENISYLPEDIDLGDIDGDGDMDYVISSTGGTNGELAWFQRQNDGTYIKWTIETGINYERSVLGDFDGNGTLDVVGTSYNQTSINVFFNDGGGMFAKVNILSNLQLNGVIASGDIDNDGDVDLVYGASGLSPNESRILLNDGNGNFTLGTVLVSYAFYADIDNDIQIVDFNADGIKDVVAFEGSISDGIFMWDGANNYQRKFIDNDNNGSYDNESFLIFDIDNNGFLDIVRQNQVRNRITIIYQFSGFNFTRKVIEGYFEGMSGSQMAFGDINNDGKSDLIIANNSTAFNDDISWWENINGQLYRHQIYSYLDGVRIPKFVDIDNDGDQDIVVTVSGDIGNSENELLLYENIGDNNFINWRLSDSLDYAADVEPADIDGDGDIDLFVSARDASDLIWLRNDGQKGDWYSSTIDADINQVLGIHAVDIDGDNDVDIVGCANNDDKLFWYQNNGAGTFTKFVVDANIDAPREVEAADLDGDGDIDLALASGATANAIVIYINNGTQSFTKQVAFTGKTAFDIEIADWNSDGKPDIIFTLSATSPVNPQQEVVALINNGGNAFTTTPLVINAEKGTGLKVADLDNDGDMDFVVGRNQQVRARMWLQTPTGLVGSTLSDAGASGSTPQVLGLDVADTDADGKNEIVFADFARDELVLVSFNCFSGASLTTSSINATCGQPNGSITVMPTGGTNLSYLWSNSATSATATSLAPGTYTVTVTANGGCTSTATATITALPAALVLTTKTNATCGNANGTAKANSQNGVGLVSYLWSNGETTQMISGLTAGVYTVTATDVNGCTATSSILVGATPVATLTLSTNDATCGNDNGEVTVSVSGGIPITSYVWSNGTTTQNLLNVPGGIYTVTATDGIGCAIISSTTINSTPVATLALSPNNTSCGNSDGTVTTIVTGGSPITGYLWSNGATTQNLLNVPGGTYSITATDSNGCQITGSATVIGLTNPAVNLGTDMTIQQGQQTVIDATGPGLTYLWSTGATTATITVNTMGNFTVTVTNSFGCTATDEMLVTLISSTDEFDNTYKVTIMPNPTKGVINIKCDGAATTLVQVFDNLGKLMTEDNSIAPDGAVRTLNITNCPSGIYHVKLSGKGFTKTIKVVKY